MLPYVLVYPKSAQVCHWPGPSVRSKTKSMLVDNVVGRRPFQLRRTASTRRTTML